MCGFHDFFFLFHHFLSKKFIRAHLFSSKKYICQSKVYFLFLWILSRTQSEEENLHLFTFVCFFPSSYPYVMMCLDPIIHQKVHRVLKLIKTHFDCELKLQRKYWATKRKIILKMNPKKFLFLPLFIQENRKFLKNSDEIKTPLERN
jgi:hypothetical protein